jgi:NhaP-type Na+/H+ or K+/H+ antiporter
MDQVAIDFITLGSMFLLGLGADVLGRRTVVPRVTLLVLCGLVLGPLGQGSIPAQDSRVFDMVGSVALVMVVSRPGAGLAWRYCPRQVLPWVRRCWPGRPARVSPDHNYGGGIREYRV